MEIVQNSVEILDTAPSYEDVLMTFNKVARNCYQSETAENSNMESAEKLARGLIKNSHEAMLEFGNIPVHFVADRSFTGQLTRHRMCSFAVESARFNNYTKDKFNGIKVIPPVDMTNEGYAFWRAHCLLAEGAYVELIEKGCKPETARSVLPMCLATSIMCSANIREWRHIFNLRCDPHAQIDIRTVMLELLGKMYEKYPVFFEDLAEKFLGIKNNS